MKTLQLLIIATKSFTMTDEEEAEDVDGNANAVVPDGVILVLMMT